MHTHEGINQVRLCFLHGLVYWGRWRSTVDGGRELWWSSDWSRALMSSDPGVDMGQMFNSGKGSPIPWKDPHLSHANRKIDALGCSRLKADSGCKGFRSPDCIWLKNRRTSNTSVNSVFPESGECDLIGSSLLEIKVEVFSVWKGHPDWMALPWETGQN